MSSIIPAQADPGSSKLILVIGATGAQGTAVIGALLHDSVYRIRVFTRDASNPRFKALKALDPGRVESFEGTNERLLDSGSLFRGIEVFFREYV